MSNSLDEPDGSFLVLMNHEAQYSLWPEFAEIPDGWTVAHQKSDRQTCLDYIEQQWTDMRPKSLVNDMTGDAA
ncbi:MbtH family protein [Streptomyces platensis]|uniref:MbtH family protein n=1 Tax=Streptomyces platensis TaxID=58346 RepID=UPI00386B59E9|nr:MbtH family protein [Streptomyces platensis]